MTTSTEIHLARRPHGRPTHDDFRTVAVELPELADGEARVENAFVSVDPYMRGKMNEGRSYTQPYALDAAMSGAAVGRGPAPLNTPTPPYASETDSKIRIGVESGTAA